MRRPYQTGGGPYFSAKLLDSVTATAAEDDARYERRARFGQGNDSLDPRGKTLTFDEA